MMLRSGRQLGVNAEESGNKSVTVPAGFTDESEDQMGSVYEVQHSRVPLKPKSITSEVSNATSIKQRCLQAVIAAQEAIFAKEKELILKKLELQKSLIMEEEQEFREGEQTNPDEVSIATENDKTTDWVKNSMSQNEYRQEFNDLIQSMKSAFKLMGSQKPENQPQLKSFMARHTAGKELQTFGGDPKDWPGFISLFEQSTSMCGFTPDENMLRLQRCLEGRAKEAVKSILYLPDQLPSIIRTLSISFGRPSVIVKSMIQKAKNLPSPKEDKAETIIDFSNVVRNLVATMENLNCTGHLWNPQLVEELIFKLPASLRMQWGMKTASLGQEEPNLKEFSSWLENMAMAASYNPTSVSSCPPVRDSKYNDNQTPKNFTRAQKHSVFTTNGSSLHPCEVCRKDGHSIHTCDRFLAMVVEERREKVRQLRLCFFACEEVILFEIAEKRSHVGAMDVKNFTTNCCTPTKRVSLETMLGL